MLRVPGRSGNKKRSGAAPGKEKMPSVAEVNADAANAANANEAAEWESTPQAIQAAREQYRALHAAASKNGKVKTAKSKSASTIGSGDSTLDSSEDGLNSSEDANALLDFFDSQTSSGEDGSDLGESLEFLIRTALFFSFPSLGFLCPPGNGFCWRNSFPAGVSEWEFGQ